MKTTTLMLSVFYGIVLATAPILGWGVPTARGDINYDQQIDVLDIQVLIGTMLGVAGHPDVSIAELQQVVYAMGHPVQCPDPPPETGLPLTCCVSAPCLCSGADVTLTPCLSCPAPPTQCRRPSFVATMDERPADALQFLLSFAPHGPPRTA